MATINNPQSLISSALTGNKGAGNRPAGDRPQADIFVNVGITVQIPDENGEPQDVFLSLPFGLPLDTMNELTIRGNNKEWNETAAARNELLKALVQLGQSLEHGTGKEMPNLSVQLYRRKEEVEHKPTNNVMAQLLAQIG